MGIRLLIMFLIIGSTFACQGDRASPAPTQAKISFKNHSADSTGINFINEIQEGPNMNVLMYEYFYNGGGVAAADFNSDGLIDLFFTANVSANKMYLNEGNLNFKDVTQSANAIGRKGPWKTGVTACDVNGDGLIDLYLCYSGALPHAKRKNQLLINIGNDQDGVPQFEDQAENYGLASTAYSNQAYFLDYDRDGDLDMLLLNHNPKSLPILNVDNTKRFLEVDDSLSGLRLYRHDNGRFTDVTLQSNINGSALSYGLGLGIADIDQDGWMDFYVSNDYDVPDYLYLNKGDGTFHNRILESLDHTSHFSMGNDIADVNNDGYADILTLDMLPEDNKRQKLLLSPDSYDKFDLMLKNDFHHQYMRNMLQINDGKGQFMEVGQFSGISNTDWSWSALWADFDNDGRKDLYITNGYLRDYTNLDFIDYMDDYVQSKGRLKRQDVLSLIEKMPSSQLSNYLFVQEDDLRFINATKSSSIEIPSNSNGAAYADLDNDGDLDIVVNNINQTAFVFENQSPKGNYIKFNLQGASKNTQGIGCQVNLHIDEQIQTLTQMPTRGYLSTVTDVLHFSIGESTKIDSVCFIWNSGKIQTLYNPKINQTISLFEKDAKHPSKNPHKIEPIFTLSIPPINHKDQRSNVNDFNRQSLLLTQYSQSSPCLSTADFNNDGLSDIYIGGVKDSLPKMYFQKSDGSFVKGTANPFQLDRECHDMQAIALDLNKDSNMDLYVSSGGYHNYQPHDDRLKDRIYIGDGNGNFQRYTIDLDDHVSSSSAIAAGDFDHDGDLDVFVGGYVTPGAFPKPPNSVLLQNDGSGHFKDVANKWSEDLSLIGMVSDALWIDLNQDDLLDLIVVGQWMAITVFINKGDHFDIDRSYFSDKEEYGFWNSINIGDINHDGLTDYIFGNLGQNTQLQASPDEPLCLNYADFDQNGSIDPILSYFNQGVRYPFMTRKELLAQLTYLKPRYNSYNEYSDANLKDIFINKEIEKSDKLIINNLESLAFVSTEDGNYKKIDLPKEAQFSSIKHALINDYTGDGINDILTFGNNSSLMLRLGKLDANHGFLFEGKGDGTFDYLAQQQSGLNIRGDVNAVLELEDGILLGIHNEGLKVIKHRNE